jgi:hypothetical protein
MICSSGFGRTIQWLNTGVGDRRLASFMTMRCCAAGMRGSKAPPATADEAISIRRRLRSTIAFIL